MSRPSFPELESKLRHIRFEDPFCPTLHHSASLHDLGERMQSALAAHGPAPKVLLVSDGVPKLCAEPRGQLSVDEAVKGLFGSVQVEHLVANPDAGYPESQALASLKACEHLGAELRLRRPDVLVALGSGSLTDLCKHALHSSPLENVSFWVIPTALTVTAFTSAFAVLEKAGHKSTFPSKLPDHTFFCDEILAGAPLELTKAGVGDLAAGFVSYADWRLGAALGFEESFEPQALALMTSMQRRLVRGKGQAVANLHAPECLSSLSELLAAAGVAMNLGRSSAPQSGGEHAISHVLDLLRTVTARPKWPHGLQVALASVASCGVYDWLFEQDFIPIGRLQTLSGEDLAGLARRTFYEAPFSGDPREFDDEKKRKALLDVRRHLLEEECESASRVAAKKALMWAELKERFPDFQKDWSHLREELRSLTLTQMDFLEMLTSWGLPDCPENMSPPGHHAEFRWAVRYSVFFRERFGVGDLAFWLGEDPVIVSAV